MAAIYQTQLEQKVFDLLEKPVGSIGYAIVRVKIFQSGRSKTLQLMIEKADGENVIVDDCEKVSRHVSVILDVEDMTAAENWAANDPYAKAGLFASCELVQWNKVIG